MKEYIVKFSITYGVKVKDENEAIEKGKTLFAREIDNLMCGLTEICSVQTILIKEET